MRRRPWRRRFSRRSDERQGRQRLGPGRSIPFPGDPLAGGHLRRVCDRIWPRSSFRHPITADRVSGFRHCGRIPEPNPRTQSRSLMEDFYTIALARMSRLAAAVGVAGTRGALVWKGPRTAVGFLVGALISMVNLRWWTSLASALGNTPGSPPLRGSTALLGMRYLLVGAAIYVIVKVLEITLAAVLAGLFVSVAAVIIEILFELVSSGKKHA